MRYDVANYNAVMTLLRRGLSDYAVARQTGIKRGTIRHWRRANRPPQTIVRGQLAASWYFFSNLSEDIRTIVRDHCLLLGIRVKQSNHRNLTVSHRKSVAILEEVVGPEA